MRVIARSTLREFWERDGRADAMQPLVAWFREAERAEWKSPADIKRQYATASFVGHDRVVFNVGGNKHRLVIAVRYELGIVFIRFVGTHAHYDRIDVRKV